MSSIERTAFSASREMYLKQIDIPKLYFQNSLQNIESEVEIVELNGEQKIVFSGRSALLVLHWIQLTGPTSFSQQAFDSNQTQIMRFV